MNKTVQDLHRRPPCHEMQCDFGRFVAAMNFAAKSFENAAPQSLDDAEGASSLMMILSEEASRIGDKYIFE